MLFITAGYPLELDSKALVLKRPHGEITSQTKTGPEPELTPVIHGLKKLWTLVHEWKVLAISPFLTDLRPAAQEGKHTWHCKHSQQQPMVKDAAIGTNGKAAAVC